MKKLVFWAFVLAAVVVYLMGCNSCTHNEDTPPATTSSVVTTTTEVVTTTAAPVVMEDPTPTRTHADILAELEIAQKRCDWDSISRLMNELIEFQNKNFYSVEVETR